MRILYKDEDGIVSAAKVYLMAYDPRGQTLFWEEESKVREIKIDQFTAQEVIRYIYEYGQIDITVYGRATENEEE